MLGIGYHLDKWTKQKIIAEKAREYNTIKDTMLQSGVPYASVAKEIQKTLYEKRHREDGQDGTGELQGIGGSINLGYSDAHKTMSEAHSMNHHLQKCREQDQGTSRKEQREMD
jgi:hypothetical protein